MAYLAFGLFLLLLGAPLVLVGTVPYVWAGWVTLALGAVFVVTHIAVGRPRGA